MAQRIAAITTLALFKANVRLLSGTLSQQESGLIELQLNDIVHFAVTNVRVLAGKFIDGFYTVLDEGLTFAGNPSIPDYSATLAGSDIADINKMTLFSETLGEIPLVARTQFNAVRALYPPTDIGATAGIASVSITTASPPVLNVDLYSNSAAAPTDVDLTFVRNPSKVVLDIDTMDLPESLIPIAIDFAVANSLKKIGKPVPEDVMGRLTAYLGIQAQQLGLKLSPQTV